MVEATRQDKIFMVGEISMFSCNIWTVIDPKLSEIFSKVAELSSVGLSMIDICHYLQLNSVRGRFIISRFASKGKMNQLLLLQSWLLFKYAELKLVVRQTDHIFVLVENNICVDTVDVKILKSFQKARFTGQSDNVYSNDALHKYAENKPTVLRNQIVISNYLLKSTS